tara:strand:+ start:56 stop:2602 length:2547 start_codon:yes stop_codon:yes gene_type:complete
MTIHDVAVALAAQAERVCSVLLPGGKRVGQKWFCGDCTGIEGESMSVELEGPKCGLWFDQASEEGGDMIDLIAANKLMSKGLATKWAKEFLGIKDDFKPAEGIFDPLTMRWLDKKTGQWIAGSAAWPYHEEDGTITAYVVRFNFDGGRKDVIPMRLVDGKWKWTGWKGDEKRPLFNAHKLAKLLTAPVLVVEGEKTAVAAQKLFPKYVVTTCQGGTPAFQKANWDLIKHRTDLVLWPDADKSGRQAMTYVKGRMPQARVVDTSTLPDGWDLADPVPDNISIQALLDGAGELGGRKQTEAPTCPYRCLGHTDDGFYYLSHRSGRIEQLPSSQHTELQLQVLASDTYWIEAGFCQPKSTGVDWKAVAKHLFDQQFEAGVYNPERIRGLGCWLEENPNGTVTVVYHAGDHLIVDGAKTDLFHHKSKWIYPRRQALSVDVSEVATVAEIKPFLDMCDLLPWHSQHSSWIYAGVLFLLPICGVLPWRPNAWMLGPSGVGKSWCYSHITAPMAGHCIRAMSSTTAAGIRQTLQCDAIPVLIDELEGKDEESNKRIRAMNELVRSSSTETGGSIYKGTPGGDSQKFMTRSSFIMSSIAMGATESADEARFARLEFRYRPANDGAEKFKQIEALCRATTGNPDFIRKMLARAIHHAYGIRRACDIFADAIRRKTGDSRKGQQYGAISAGYWFLRNDAVPTQAQADYFVSQVDWDAITSGQSKESDPGRATDIILQAKIDMQDNQGHTYRYNVGDVLFFYYSDKDGKRDAAYESLMRIGLHPVYGADNGRFIDVACRHTELQKIFAHTQFADKWADYFKRLDNSELSVYTPRGAKSIRAIRVPKTAFVMDEQLDAGI